MSEMMRSLTIYRYNCVPANEHIQITAELTQVPQRVDGLSLGRPGSVPPPRGCLLSVAQHNAGEPLSLLPLLQPLSGSGAVPRAGDGQLEA